MSDLRKVIKFTPGKNCVTIYPFTLGAAFRLLGCTQKDLDHQISSPVRNIIVGIDPGKECELLAVNVGKNELCFIKVIRDSDNIRTSMNNFSPHHQINLDESGQHLITTVNGTTYHSYRLDLRNKPEWVRVSPNLMLRLAAGEISTDKFVELSGHKPEEQPKMAEIAALTDQIERQARAIVQFVRDETSMKQLVESHEATIHTLSLKYEKYMSSFPATDFNLFKSTSDTVVHIFELLKSLRIFSAASQIRPLYNMTRYAK